MFACAWEEGGPRYRQADDSSLEIWNVTRRNAGVYTVKCTNEEGENQTTIKLDVQCKKLHTHRMWFHHFECTSLMSLRFMITETRIIH